MQCIVCEGPADLIEPLTRDAKAIRCPCCGVYEISVTAEAVLSHKDAYKRLQSLRLAQTDAQAGRRPFIHGEV